MSGVLDEPWRESFALHLRAKGLAQSTVRGYLYDVALFLRWLQPESADKADILSFLDWYSGHAKQSSIVRRFAAIKHYHAWLVERGAGLENPCDGIRLRPPSFPPKEPFTEDELRRILASCRRPQERAMVRLLIDTGLRLTELSRLRLKDLNLDRRTIRVLGKGGKERLLALGERSAAALRLCMDGRDYPWHSQRIHGPMTPDGVYRLLRRLGQRTGIRIHPHRFRVTFACRFAEISGDNMDSLQVLMGHAKLETTLQYAAWGRAERALDRQREIALGDRL